MIISFAWTTPALLAGAKTVTRRAWMPVTAAKFHVGDVVDAWNQTPRVNSARRGIRIARQVATIRITRDPWVQNTREVGPDDYRREGFEWLFDHDTDAPCSARMIGAITKEWRERPRDLYVVEFELVEVVG